MSSLLLLRHGQASLHARDYDELSAVGAEQARQLGFDWAERQLAVDALYCGPRRRHRDSAEQLRDAAAERGHSIPEPVVIEGFDEIDIQRVNDEAMRRVLPSCPGLPDELASGEMSEDGKLAMQHFTGILRKMFERWANGEPGFDLIESYEVFSSRVHASLHQVMREQGQGKRVAVLTSGGPVAIASRLAMGFAPSKSVDLMWVIRNMSVTELQYGKDALTLTGFNSVSHLHRRPELITQI